MARRVVMGRMSNGSYDLRISRRGYDALTADVNNDRQISFSAQRTASAKVGAAGQIADLETWVSFGKTFDVPPPTLAALKRSNRIHYGFFEILPLPNGENGYCYGTPFCLVVQETRIIATKVLTWTGYTIPSGDKFQFYTLADS